MACTHQRSGTPSRSSYDAAHPGTPAGHRPRLDRVAGMRRTRGTGRGASRSRSPALDPDAPAAVVRPPRRRRRRPGDHRRRAPRAGRAGAGADRHRDRAARRVRRPGAPALGAGGPARAVDREHARAPSTRATAARSRCCWSTSTRASRSTCAAATGSPSWSSSGSSRRAFVEVERLPGSARGDGRVRFHRRFRAETSGRRAPRRRTDVPPQEVRRARRAATSADDARGRRAGRTRGADGPWDASEVTLAEDDADRVDLGSLLLTPREGLELRLQVDEATGEVSRGDAGRRGRRRRAARLRRAPQRRHLGRRAPPDRRPRSPGRAAPPPSARAPGAPRCWSRLIGRPRRRQRVQQASRVIGINGPRWLLRATLFGRPAVEHPSDGDVERRPAATSSWSAARTPMPPGDPLPLTMPPNAQRLDRA